MGLIEAPRIRLYFDGNGFISLSVIGSVAHVTASRRGGGSERSPYWLKAPPPGARPWNSPQTGPSNFWIFCLACHPLKARNINGIMKKDKTAAAAIGNRIMKIKTLMRRFISSGSRSRLAITISHPSPPQSRPFPWHLPNPQFPLPIIPRAPPPIDPEASLSRRSKMLSVLAAA